MERLPVQDDLTGEETFPFLRDGKAARGKLTSLITRSLVQANAAARWGGGGRHTYEKSVARAPAQTPEAGDAFLAVRDGQAITLFVDELAGGGGESETGASILEKLLTVDGAGSGIDADLLDGQSGSYYANIPARLGFTPLDAASYTASDVFTKVLSLDGAGSGLDADLLDGQSGAFYLAWANLTGVPSTFTPSSHTHAQSEITNLVTDLAAKAPLASPALTGNPTTPNQSAGNNSTRIANTAYVDSAIASLIGTVPGTLDTLDEIAAALGDDPNFATTIATSIGTKLAKASNLSDLANASTARTNLGVAIGTDVAAQSHVGSGGSAHANAVASGAAGFMTGSDKAKLDGIASAATANDTDANLKNRTNHTGTQSADTITDGTTNKAYTATEKTKLSGIETAADVTDAGNVGSSIHGASAKSTPVDADTVALIDSAASNVLKKLSWANIKATLKTYFDTLYATIASPTFTGTITAAAASFSGTVQCTANSALRGQASNITVSSGSTDGFSFSQPGAGAGILSTSADSDISLYARRRSTNGALMSFWRDTTEVGGIAVNTTATVYNTSSDKRLKDDPREFTRSGEIIDNLQIWDFRWKATGERSVGVFAQDAYRVFPLAVTRERGKGKWGKERWGVDYSKYVPVMLEEMQRMRRRIAELEARQ